MRASTLTRSMPTSETRTYASITMPLSSTRSRTSIRLLPAAERSTAMRSSPRDSLNGLLQFGAFDYSQPRRQLVQLVIDSLQLRCIGHAAGKVGICAPPVHSDLFSFVNRADEQTYLDR